VGLVSEIANSEPRIHHLLDAAAERSPNVAAVADASSRWTYRELADISRQWAAWLKDHGARAGTRIAVHAAADHRTVALVYACSRIGSTFIPVATSARDREIDAIIRDSDPTVIIPDLESLAAAESETTSYPVASPSSTNVTSPAPALLIYTSGSVARPKGVICPHEQVMFVTRTIADRLRYRAEDVVFSRLPLSFDYGLYQIFLTALAGAELVLADHSADTGLLAAIRRHAATVVPLVPSLATALLKLAARDHNPNCVRLFTNTGEELPRATIAALRQSFPSAGIQLMYGITECKRVSIMDVDGDLTRQGTVGKPLSGTQVRIVDGSGRSVPPGVTGEIVVVGPHVMAGYWRSAELSAKVFGRDEVTGARLLRTGDYGFIDDDGYLYFRGRRDDIFKINGMRTSSIEIEAAAGDIPGVQEAAVLPPHRGGAILYVVATIASVDVLKHLRERIDPRKVPGECRVVLALPRGANGKIDRAALRSLQGAEPR
jgi:amino acid adenylation domain-containing protein